MKNEKQNCIFVSDLHGSVERYRKLFRIIVEEHPGIVFVGGDIMPGLSMTQSASFGNKDFIHGFLAPELREIREQLQEKFPRILIILGNDDGRFIEASILDIAGQGLCEYIHNRKINHGEFNIYGYCYVPPTPFMLKDWERYDVSRYVDPGCISPEEGRLSVPAAENERKYSTIKDDLMRLTRDDDLSKSIILLHSPPYDTDLDRAALDGKMIDYVPLDVHVGSIAIRKFIEQRQPLLTLHGHIHESARITKTWRGKIGNTSMFTAAHDGPELAVIRFDLDLPHTAERELM